MFRLFKKINNNREVTTNPEVLFNSNIDTSEISVHGLKLQDKADLIPLDKISTTTFEKAPLMAMVSFDGGKTTAAQIAAAGKSGTAHLPTAWHELAAWLQARQS